MNKILLTFCIMLLSVTLWSQKVEWAFKILEYSSEKGNNDYSSRQVLGKPNVLPYGGESLHAWQSKSNKSEEFIKVGFRNPIKPRQIIIGESFNPGFVSKVYVYDADGREQEVASYTPASVKMKSRILHVYLGVDFPVIAVKVVMKPAKNLSVAIDAIGITESSVPVEIKANESEIVKSNMPVTKLNDNLNSQYIELGPLLSPDGQTLYFSRKFAPANAGGVEDKEDIWFSTWDKKKKAWGEVQNMGAPLNNKAPNFINSISPDGNTILLGNKYNPDGTSEAGVSISYRKADGWTDPKSLVIEDEVNTADNANFFLSASLKILLISINRKGDGFGSQDIYASFLKPDSSWTKPFNLGKTINTSGIEAAPFLAPDDKTLYFTSDGFAGYGGSDIYVTHRLDNSWTKWSEPENLGSAVNSPFDESYFSLSAAGDKVYFTSSKSKEGDSDMYAVALDKRVAPLPVAYISGKVINSKTGEPVKNAKILFEDLETGKEMGIARSNPKLGTYSIILPSGNKYGYLAESKGFISIHSFMDVEKLAAFTQIERDLYLAPIEVDQVVVFNNIFFDSEKYDLKSTSFPELNRLARLMKENTSMKIEISGFADSRGTKAYNDKLSNLRAKAIEIYLVKTSKIEAQRVVGKHFGELNPIADNETIKGRQLNRRVEFKILAK